MVVISADERVETVSRCIERRAKGYVPKSFSPSARHAAIGAVLSGGVFLPAMSIAGMRRAFEAGQEPEPPAREAHAPWDAPGFGLTPREFIAQQHVKAVEIARVG